MHLSIAKDPNAIYRLRTSLSIALPVGGSELRFTLSKSLFVIFAFISLSS